MQFIKNQNLDNVIFMDIETVRLTKTLEKNTPLYDSWAYKLKDELFKNPDYDISKDYIDKAALFAEFAKVVCITMGKVKNGILKCKSYYGENEEEILKDFCNDITRLQAANPKSLFGGHAIKGFDIPFLMRRCLVHGIDLPSMIDLAHLKPWEVNVIDTLELWRGTGFTGAGLINISTALGLPNPKDDIAGYQVGDVYWNEENKPDLERIRIYCEKDVLTVANVVLRIRKEPLASLTSSEIEAEKVGVLQKVFNTKTMTPADEAKISKANKALNKKEKAIADEIMNAMK